MSKAVAVRAIALAAALTAPSAAQEQAPTPIRWSAQPLSQTVTAGGVITVQAIAAIDEGWHLYALDAVDGGPIPTRITAGPAAAFTLQEKDIEKEEPKRALDPNFSVETAYYDESATFGLPITVGTNVKAGTREIEVTVRFQACNARICLRPQTATMKLEIRILEQHQFDGSPSSVRTRAAAARTLSCSAREQLRQLHRAGGLRQIRPGRQLRQCVRSATRTVGSASSSSSL